MKPLIFLAGVAAVAGCAAGFPNPTVPTGLRPLPAADARMWARSTLPAKWILIRFSWRKRDSEGSNGGRGAIWFYPPDSLQVHVLASLGLFRGDAAVVGDSALWAEPKEHVERLVPSYQLLWAMIGVARPPGQGWIAESRQDTKSTSVLYTRASDTVRYVSIRAGEPRLETYVVVSGRPIGQSWTYYDQFRHLLRARLQVLTSPVLLDITFDSTTKQVSADKESWNATSDH